MNSPTKKSLFFLVLSIVCNFTLSDEISECIDNVHEVFLEDMEPNYHFKKAMLAFSIPLFSSMESTEDLKEHFEFYKEVIENIGNQILLKNHSEVIGYYINKFDHLKEVQYQENLIGYMRSLVSNFDRLAEKINGIAMSPSQFCEQNYDDQRNCQMALLIMVNEIGDGDFVPIYNRQQETSAKDIFVHLFLNYNYLDFIPKYPGNSGSSISGTHLFNSINVINCDVIYDHKYNEGIFQSHDKCVHTNFTFSQSFFRRF